MIVGIPIDAIGTFLLGASFGVLVAWRIYDRLLARLLRSFTPKQ